MPPHIFKEQLKRVSAHRSHVFLSSVCILCEYVSDDGGRGGGGHEVGGWACSTNIRLLVGNSTCSCSAGRLSFLRTYVWMGAVRCYTTVRTGKHLKNSSYGRVLDVSETIIMVGCFPVYSEYHTMP